MSRGDTPTFTITITRSDVPVDITTALLWMTAKYKLEDPDGAAVFQKVSPSGGIVLSDPTNGIAKATLEPGDTTGIAVPSPLFYDVQMKEADGTITTVANGRLRVALDSTIASS